jgi:hypothetical protein
MIYKPTLQNLPHCPPFDWHHSNSFSLLCSIASDPLTSPAIQKKKKKKKKKRRVKKESIGFLTFRHTF